MSMFTTGLFMIAKPWKQHKYLPIDKWVNKICREIHPVHPKGDQSWVFIGRTDAEAETPILWPPDGKSSFEKTLMLGKIEGRRRRG